MTSFNESQHQDAVRLLIGDPHTLLCEAVAATAAKSGYANVRTATSLDDILKLVSMWQPTLVLLDATLASADRFLLLDRIMTISPRASILLMMHDSQPIDLIVTGFLKGAVGIVSKDRGIASLMRALNAVARGEAVIPRHLSRAIIDALRQGPVILRNDIHLSNRQRMVLALMAQGLSDKDISERLQISPATVRSHVDAIFEKTNTNSRTAAVRWAFSTLREPA